ncbi:Cwf15/Cwc15 cell cycle control protein [Cardiosporidium cionae]|uniref:Cwf15/Cwc15 cell cycle control protein n=1 Tax=Cardiosporidium cionae TaxID=476202 RepID=A0ABQ7JEG6_9APIC|nr:Cwf15/Cwc15 cell cycle control protein [Cardiosporidium cionae]|eukprot:KAF8822402.1 Cwf15/Cwc15 cell cycle control protein [Cardiosporidium cionae]
MTTAHRPTWFNAVGGDNQGGNRLVSTTKVAARDLKSHMTLKTRQFGQGNVEELSKKDFRQDLSDKERKYFAAKKHSESFTAITEVPHFSNLAERPELQDENSFPEDADDDPAVTVSSSESEEDSEDDAEEEAELRRELEKIAKEREEEAKKKRDEQARIDGQEHREKVLRGNPLLGNSTRDGEWLKRRWDDDVVFKNQAKGLPKAKKTFINDTVRSEFHKKFLSKYIL